MFVETIIKNASGGKIPNLQKFVDDVFKKSKLYINPDIKYRPAGSRYVTLVYNRKQLGSVVSLGKEPFLIRLNAIPQYIHKSLDDLLPDMDSQERESLVRDVESNEATLTGFGDAIVDLKKLMAMDPSDAVKTLNAIITAVEMLLFENENVHGGAANKV
ncbi:MAG: hypothetical protein CL573_03245 [Alphaproteobacteria bacterium]|nr:hypothetical protein [Alphaproteobacteria bacterium]